MTPWSSGPFSVGRWQTPPAVAAGPLGPALAVVLLALSLLTLPGCSGSRDDLALPPGPSPVPVEASAPRDAPPAKPKPPQETTVVIEDGDDSGEQSLVEASRKAKKERESAEPPVAVINNDNLSEYAAQGRVTTADPDLRPSSGADSGDGDTVDDEERSEQYWRSGARELRQQWREAADEVEALAQRAESLRNRFYSEDDIYLRDTRIKPAWDRVLDRLERARSEVDLTRTELEAFLDEGRRSGALPGWLREGVELEPRPPEPDSSLPELEVGEPDVAEDPPLGARR